MPRARGPGPWRCSPQLLLDARFDFTFIDNDCPLHRGPTCTESGPGGQPGARASAWKYVPGVTSNRRDANADRRVFVRRTLRCHTLRNSPLQNHTQMLPGELSSDFRARIALEQAHSQEVRRNELLELSATANPPHARIRAWERTHGLTLPRAAEHPVLNSVAAATRLTLDQVHAEQRRRLMPVSSPAALPSAG